MLNNPFVEMPEPGGSDGEDEEVEAPSSSSAGNFFDTNIDATDLLFTDTLLDEPVPGESDDDDDGSSLDFAARRRRRRGKKNPRRVVVSLVSCKYDVVAQAARALGWRCTIDDSEEFNLLWNDSYVPFDTIAALNKYQKTNHFPGMSELAKKNLLAKNLNRIAKALPGEFNFVPPTFILPGEVEPLKNWFTSQARTLTPSTRHHASRCTHARTEFCCVLPRFEHLPNPHPFCRSGGPPSFSNRTRGAKVAAYFSQNRWTSASRLRA